jgi:hypothetical protein
MGGVQEVDLKKMDDPMDDCTHWLSAITRKKECERSADKILQRKLRRIFGES